MEAIVRADGRQLRLVEGQEFEMNRIEGEPGDTVNLDVMMVLDGPNVTIGRPLVAGASVQARITQLCQSCHQQGRHQTIPGVPASIWIDNKACLNCHSQIHGTNHPSGPLFQR